MGPLFLETNLYHGGCAWYKRGQRQLQVGSGFKRMVGMNPLVVNLEDNWVSCTAYSKFGMEPAESVDRVLVRVSMSQDGRHMGCFFCLVRIGWDFKGAELQENKLYSSPTFDHLRVISISLSIMLHTVDRGNPSPPWMVETLYTINYLSTGAGFLPSTVLSWHGRH